MENNSALTLTQLAHVGRLTIKYGLILLVVLMVGRTSWSAFSAYWIATHPPAPPPPAMDFGPLPPLQFPSKAENEKPNSYQLETASGTLPDFGDRAQVFMMPKSAPSLLADERVKRMAANYGFVFEPQKLSDSKYRWTKSTPLQATLEIDSNTNAVSLFTNYLSKPELLAEKNLPIDPVEANRLVKSFVTTGQSLPADLTEAIGKVTFLKSATSELVPAVSFSDADFLQVDLNRAPILDIYEMFTPEGRKGVVHAIISGGFTGRDQIVHFEYNYHPVDYEQVTEYPLRSVNSAWQLLQAGEGYIANKGEFDTAVIRDVYLGYYDNFEEQEYLQPVYVFEGDGGFLGYIPAVAPGAVQQTSAPASTR